MKKEQLQNFVEVVEAGSINKAAEILYVSQPSLSRSLHALEEEMGKELLIRTSRGVTLSATGKTFYNYAKSILSQFQVLERLKNLDEDTLYTKLSISVDSMFLKDDIIIQFYESIKSTETEIQLVETTAEVVMDNVSRDISEIGITVLNDYQLKTFKKMAEIKELDVEILGSGPLYIHIDERDELAKKDTIYARDLLNHTYIHLPFDFFSNLNRTLDLENVQITSFSKSITMSNYHAILKMMRNTNGFLLGHKWQIEELKKSHIKTIALENNIYTKSLVVVTKKKEKLSHAGEVFMKIFLDQYHY